MHPAMKSPMERPIKMKISKLLLALFLLFLTSCSVVPAVQEGVTRVVAKNVVDEVARASIKHFQIGFVEWRVGYEYQDFRAFCTGTKHGVIEINWHHLNQVYYKYGEWAIRVIVAHEMAHIATCNGIPQMVQTHAELLADCLAGDFMATEYYMQGLQQQLNFLYDIGDYNFYQIHHHGTPQQRQQMFMLGYEPRANGIHNSWEQAAVRCGAAMQYKISIQQQ